MAKIFLAINFFAAAVQVVVPTLLDQLGLTQSAFVYPCLYLPAVILGLGSWIRLQSFARSWPVLACMAVVWIGMFRTASQGDELTTYEELRTAALLTLALPLGALVVEHRCWWFCARTFVFGCAAVLAVLLWLEISPRFEDLETVWKARFGFIYSRDGSTRLMDPNYLGSQLALGAVLAFMLHIRGARAAAAPHGLGSRPRFGLGWALFLTIGAFLTASRTALLCWFVGSAMAFIWGTALLERTKVRDLLVQVAILLLVALILTTSGSATPWQAMLDRFHSASADELLSFNGRMSIWHTAWQAWRSDSNSTLMGIGLSRVDDMVGKHSQFAVVTANGATLDTHNSFLKWLLGYGLIGSIPLACLLVSLVLQARKLDARDGTANRQAILLYVLVLAMSNGAFFQRLFWLALGPLILAMLSEPGPAARPSLPPLVQPSLEPAR